MALIIIIGIIFLVVSFIRQHDYLDDFTDKVLAFILSILHGVLGCMVGFVIGIILPAKTEIVNTTYYLTTLCDNTSINGAFFLGSGVIDGTMKYSMYLENADGTYQLFMTDYNLTKIKYSNDRPKIVTKTEQPTKCFYNYFAIDLDYTTTYIIYVPNGSIKSNFELDAK